MQQQKGVQAAQYNKINQLEQWFFCWGQHDVTTFYISCILLHSAWLGLIFSNVIFWCGNKWLWNKSPMSSQPKIFTNNSQIAQIPNLRFAICRLRRIFGLEIAKIPKLHSSYMYVDLVQLWHACNISVLVIASSEKWKGCAVFQICLF